LKLNKTPNEISQTDIDTLRTFGFSDRHIQEAIVMTGIARYANTTSFGLGSAPDFQNERARFGSGAGK
jgi:alkylhydroperoxidase family enzyme